MNEPIYVEICGCPIKFKAKGRSEHTVSFEVTGGLIDDYTGYYNHSQGKAAMKRSTFKTKINPAYGLIPVRDIARLTRIIGGAYFDREGL